MAGRGLVDLLGGFLVFSKAMGALTLEVIVWGTLIPAMRSPNQPTVKKFD